MDPNEPRRPSIPPPSARGGEAIIIVGGAEFSAHFRDDLAPQTCNGMRRLLPLQGQALHARWSGEAFWLPLGRAALPVVDEAVTSYPAPGDILAHRRGSSEAEILFAYGPCRFASRAGKLAGTPFLTIIGGLERLAVEGRRLLTDGASPLLIRLAA